MVQAGGIGARKVGSSGAEVPMWISLLLVMETGTILIICGLMPYQQRESFQRLTDLVHTAVSGAQHWRREELEREASFVQ